MLVWRHCTTIMEWVAQHINAGLEQICALLINVKGKAVYYSALMKREGNSHFFSNITMKKCPPLKS